jgi:N-acetylglucosaminyldiphosphoundecaprenol N-acetyl-beta-D-mannosaminyltransferase
MTFRDAILPDGLRLKRDPYGERREKGMQSDGVSLTLTGSKDLVQPDDLSRQVFGVLGIPIDVLDLATLLEKIRDAVETRTAMLLSTPNVNFLMTSRSDADFRESLVMSDLCPADGMPIIWIARLLGVPIRERLAGSDVFEALRSAASVRNHLKVFLFGGAENAAERVCKRLNAEPGGMVCVGALNPGFGSVAELSTSEIIETIEASQADLLTVFLSAKKAQEWLRFNHKRLNIPVRAQFGATVNMQAGTIRRAPKWIRSGGFEWLWRIKEEPYLWRRYWNDGCGLLYLVLTTVIPLVASRIGRHLTFKAGDLVINRSEQRDEDVIKLSGTAVAKYVDLAIPHFRKSLRCRKKILVDISDVSAVDARFFGLFLMLRKQLSNQGLDLEFLGLTPWAVKTFRLNGFEFLLNSAH